MKQTLPFILLILVVGCERQTFVPESHPAAVSTPTTTSNGTSTTTCTITYSGNTTIYTYVTTTTSCTGCVSRSVYVRTVTSCRKEDNTFDDDCLDEIEEEIPAEPPSGPEDIFWKQIFGPLWLILREDSRTWLSAPLNLSGCLANCDQKNLKFPIR